MYDDQTERRIARFLAGECSGREVAELHAWMAVDPVRAKYVEELRRTWETAGELPAPWDSRPAWEAVRTRIERPARDAGQAPDLQVVRNAKRRAPSFALPARSPLVRIAAVITLLLGSAGIWWTSSRHAVTAPAPAALREVATRPGERAEIYLSDGTRVLLGVGSKLRFAAPLGKDLRDVYLDGEALFEVTHDEKWPFRVRTARGIAEDLGTRFNVRAYEADSTVTVVVAEGKVALAQGVGARAKPIVLTPGELGEIDAAGEITVRTGVDVDRHLAWTEGRLLFENAPLRDVVAQLSRWYDLDFRLADPSLGDRRLTASFAGESVDQLVRYIALTLDLRREHRGRTVTFYPSGRSRR